MGANRAVGTVNGGPLRPYPRTRDLVGVGGALSFRVSVRSETDDNGRHELLLGFAIEIGHIELDMIRDQQARTH